MNDLDSENFERIQDLLDTYQPSEETVDLVKGTRIALLVGVSGSGKGTIKERLLQTGLYHHIVSYTTRKPRVNNGVPEKDGVDYHFINLAKAAALLEAGEYVEAKVYSGNVYGTAIADIEAAQNKGKIALTDIEVQGAAEYTTISPNVTAIFVLPPSMEAWRERVMTRGEMEEADMLRRLRTAPEELRAVLGEPSYKFVINDSLEDVVDYTRSIIETGNVDPARQQAGRELTQVLLEQTTQFLEDHQS